MEYLDLSNTLTTYRQTMHEATKALVKDVKEHIQPFIYDEAKTEWYVPAGQALNAYIESTFDFTRKELEELSETGFKTRDIRTLTTRETEVHDQRLVPIQSAEGFIALVELLLDMEDDTTQETDEAETDAGNDDRPKIKPLHDGNAGNQ